MEDVDYVDEDGSKFDSIEKDTVTSLQMKREAVKLYHENKGKWNFYKSFRNRYRTALHPSMRETH